MGFNWYGPCVIQNLNATVEDQIFTLPSSSARDSFGKIFPEFLSVYLNFCLDKGEGFSIQD